MCNNKNDENGAVNNIGAVSVSSNVDLNNPTNDIVAGTLGSSEVNSKKLDENVVHKDLWRGMAIGLAVVCVLIIMCAFSVIYVALIDAFSSQSDNQYKFTLFGLVMVSMIRIISIIVGAAIAFGGLSVSYFAHTKSTNINVGNEKGEKKVAGSFGTYSPGIFAVIVGATVIVMAIKAKNTFQYEPPAVIINPVSEVKVHDPVGVKNAALSKIESFNKGYEEEMRNGNN